MSAKFSVERVLRDPDDASGQSVRAWTVTAEGGRLEVAGGVHDGAYAPVCCRYEDVEALISDIRRAVAAAAPANGEP